MPRDLKIYFFDFICHSNKSLKIHSRLEQKTVVVFGCFSWVACHFSLNNFLSDLTLRKALTGVKEVILRRIEIKGTET